MVEVNDKTETGQVFAILSNVVDPEIPVLTLQDLGVLRDVSIVDGAVEVTITPTYAGCPAMETMRSDIQSALATAGYTKVSVREILHPAWSTDWMTKSGREKLRAYGIAPPVKTSCGKPAGLIECPQCNSTEVKLISEFGSTACKALYQCGDCREPFDYFKCL